MAPQLDDFPCRGFGHVGYFYLLHDAVENRFLLARV
jgi:hypothetical protein